MQWSLGSRVEWMDGGRRRTGEVTHIFTSGRHVLDGDDREWRATADSPLYLVETESGARCLVPQALTLPN